MPAFFPRQTIAWHLERPGALRALTLSVVESGLLTGVVVRLLRALLMPRSLVAYGLVSTVLLAALGEMVTSVPLIALHREPWGSGRAEFGDWPQMALWAALNDIAIVTLFALLLGAVVQVVRYGLVRHEHRGHTLAAIHEERLRERKSLD